MPDEEKGTNRMGDLKMAYGEQITKIFLGYIQLKKFYLRIWRKR